MPRKYRIKEVKIPPDGEVVFFPQVKSEIQQKRWFWQKRKPSKIVWENFYNSNLSLFDNLVATTEERPDILFFSTKAEAEAIIKKYEAGIKDYLKKLYIKTAATLEDIEPENMQIHPVNNIDNNPDPVL